MPIRKAQSISYAHVVAGILDWIENPEGEDFELETNRIPDERNSDK